MIPERALGKLPPLPVQFRPQIPSSRPACQPF